MSIKSSSICQATIKCKFWNYVSLKSEVLFVAFGYTTSDRELRSDTFSYLLYVFFNLEGARREARNTKRVPFRNATHFNVIVSVPDNRILLLYIVHVQTPLPTERKVH